MRSLWSFWHRRLIGVALLSAGLGAVSVAIVLAGAPLWGLVVLGGGALGLGLLLRIWQHSFQDWLAVWSSEIAERLQQVARGLFSIRFAPDDSPTEFRRLLEQLNAAVERVESERARVRKLERVRSEFLGNVSHELRNPLFALHGYLETLAELPLELPAQEFVHKALHHAQRLETLLTQLLELSHIESGAARMYMRVFDLVELARQVLAVFEERARQWSLTLVLQASEEPLEVVADRERIEQVLSNLVDNALKYNRPGGTVWVRLKPEGRTVRVEVADTGIGIPKEHQERVFERFYRVRSAQGLSSDGSGLGLAIVKHILQAHQAPYELESTPGVGTTVRFWLRR